MGAHVFHFADGLWDGSAKDAAAIIGDEQVVFDADATEVLVGFQLVVVDEILVLAFGFPDVDEGRDEVDARLIGDHETWLEGLAATQAAEALVGGTWCDVVVADVGLAEAFHVVHVHAEHVAEAVRHEEVVSTSHQGFFGVAFHQADAFQSINQGAAGEGVHLHVRHVGTRVGSHFLVTLDPSDKPSEPVQHDGEEFNLVIKGSIVVTFDDQEIVLHEGDSIYFNPTHPHGQKCLGTEPATFLTMIAE